MRLLRLSNASYLNINDIRRIILVEESRGITEANLILSQGKVEIKTERSFNDLINDLANNSMRIVYL